MNYKKEKLKEIRQLWDSATRYFLMAKELKIDWNNSLNIRISKIYEAYKNGFPSEEKIKQLNFLIANLVSCSSRLYSIDEIHEWDFNGNYLDEEGENYEEVLSNIKNRIKKYLHQLLQDDKVYFETDLEDKWKARVEILNEITVLEAFEIIEEIYSTFQLLLRYKYSNQF